MSTVKNTTNKYVREDMEKKEPLYVVGGIINWFIHYGENYGDSLRKLKIEVPYDPVIPLLGIYPEKYMA